jgi:hypothetical protein
MDNENKCNWLRQFDSHFSISCVGQTGQRANGSFHPCDKIKETKWHFEYCPYCGKKISIVQQPL